MCRSTPISFRNPERTDPREFSVTALPATPITPGTSTVPSIYNKEPETETGVRKHQFSSEKRVGFPGLRRRSLRLETFEVIQKILGLEAQRRVVPSGWASCSCLKGGRGACDRDRDWSLKGHGRSGALRDRDPSIPLSRILVHRAIFNSRVFEGSSLTQMVKAKRTKAVLIAVGRQFQSL